jgi:dihydrodiol dehydrogenase / D-xylose 1-dehydrogenase (NADP)
LAFRWGILGPGSIARSFATGLKSIPDAELYAVGSRSQEKADKFGDEYGASKRYGSYEALVNDPDVDAIYIATPHSFHYEHGLLSLNAGKATLIEKPFTINEREAAELAQRSRELNVFLMEAMWTRFLPVIVKLNELAKSGAIGEPRMLSADFGFRAGVNPEGRLFNPALGGGALLDVGVYTISLASMLFGSPTALTGLATLGETGVDEQSAMILAYEKGELAVLSTAIRTNTVHEAILYGTEGRIRVDSPWWIPKRLTVHRDGKDTEVLDLGYEGNGYNYQAIEVANCVRAGKIESDIMPLNETVIIMKSTDTLRAQWGVKYPQE